MKNSNDETSKPRNNDEIRMTNDETKALHTRLARTCQAFVSSFEFRHSSLFRRLRISSFEFSWLILLSALLITGTARPAHAAPTQEDVFKSISSNVDDKVDGQKMLGFVAAMAGFILLMVLINNRQAREDKPKVTNHQGKLLRELMKTAGLKRSQIRQLKALSADLAAKNQPVQNLATLLLCPSLIKKARDRETRDRRS